MSAQQQGLDILQQLVNSFSNNVLSYPLLGVVLFIGFLWFFHEFREWRLSISVFTSLGITLLIMVALNPTFSPLTHILGF